jgi:hypothetical protein
MAQILVRKKLLNGTSQMLRCDVISTGADGTMRVKCGNELKPREVKASETIPVTAVFGTGNPTVARTVITKQQAPVSSLAGMLEKKYR